jgi:aquaporin Z
MKMEVSHLAGGSVRVEKTDAVFEAFEAARPEASPLMLNESLRLRGALRAVKEHWPEYLIEAAGLCVFMISACSFSVLIFHPSSVVNRMVASDFVLRALMGVMMGLTAIAIIYSPWGKRSGAHLNPATTLTFFRLGKVAPWDAILYALAQFAGAVTGVLLSALALGNLVSDSSVNYVATVPGRYGALAAFVAEALISFILMTAILFASNNTRAARWTGVLAGALVAAYISIESPISGMSMNPARTFGSAFGARLWTSIWVYFTAPPLGMLLAAEAYTRLLRGRAVMCAKLHHHNNQRCIFRCGYGRAGD